MGKSSSAKTPPPTAQEIEGGKVAVDQWNEYVDNWHQPVMNWAKGIDKNKAPEMARATGITNADIAQQAGGVERNLMAGGMNPNSGRTMMAVNNVADVTGTAGSGAAVQARQGVEDSRLQGLQQVANVGMGQKTEAVTGISDIAQQASTASLGRAKAKQQTSLVKSSANAEMWGSVAGSVAGGMTGMFDKPKTTDKP